MRKIGFTLAEVLITVSVIGIIAAVTIPLINANINESVWMGSLKADRAVLEQAFGSMMSDAQTESLDTTPIWLDSETSKVVDYKKDEDGEIEEDEEGNKITESSFEKSVNENIIQDVMKRYLNFDKMIPITSSNLSKYPIKQIKAGTKPLSYKEDSYRFELANSSAVTIWFVPIVTEQINMKKLDDNGNPKITSKENLPLATIYIDTNGKKGPDTAGKDIFYFYLDSYGKLIPIDNKQGTVLLLAEINETIDQGVIVNNDCTAIDSRTCTAKVIEDGYKIKY